MSSYVDCVYVSAWESPLLLPLQILIIVESHVSADKKKTFNFCFVFRVLLFFFFWSVSCYESFQTEMNLIQCKIESRLSPVCHTFAHLNRDEFDDETDPFPSTNMIVTVAKFNVYGDWLKCIADRSVSRVEIFAFYYNNNNKIIVQFQLLAKTTKKKTVQCSIGCAKARIRSASFLKC